VNYLSLCSGIEAASVAWSPLGWSPVAFAEIEPFPCAVLKHHYPDVPNLGDITRYADWPELAPDVVVGGTPCQSFSVAGLRAGLADPRGNLALTFLGVVDRYRPRWVVWENVPGVLSSSDGRDFGAFLGGLGELGYLGCYRVLDAQFFGLAQRRRRVFVVGYRGDWRPSAAVLFEPQSLSGNPAPSRKTGERVAPTIASRPTGGGGLGTDFDCDGGVIVARSVKASEMGHRHDPTTDDYVVTHSLRADGFDVSEDVAGVLRSGGRGGRPSSRGEHLIPFDASEDGTGRGTPLLAYAIQERAVSENPDNGPDGIGVREGIAYTLEARNKVQAVALRGREGGATAEMGDDVGMALRSSQGGGDKPHVLTSMAVRRLTPRECERLQGFPDDYTLIPYRGKPAADGPRYKALGNSMAVPVIAWLGRRIELVESVLTESQERVA